MDNLFNIPEEQKKTEIPSEGICVDCSVINGNPGNGEFRGVLIESKKIVFNYKIKGVTTNNVAEFFALVAGVNYLINNNIKGKVYTDSQTALSWYKKKSHNCKLLKDTTTQESWKNLPLCIDKIPKVNHMAYVDFWSNKLYGEIFADYGRK